jgi:hypothetical protein
MCFICQPCDAIASESPYQWSSPRSLCLEHKAAVKMEDGTLLSALLARLEPAEGSLLAWIFNPMLVGNGTRRGWTDFAGGGMAVFEDRFLATSYFEFRAFEVDRDVDLLYALLLTRTATPTLACATTTRQSIAPLISALAATEKTTMPRHLRRRSDRGALEGLRDLTRAWQFQVRLRAIRERCGQLWPQSETELKDWIDQCCGRGEPWECPEVVAPMVHALRELGHRRFTTFGSASPNTPLQPTGSAGG